MIYMCALAGCSQAYGGRQARSLPSSYCQAERRTFQKGDHEGEAKAKPKPKTRKPKESLGPKPSTAVSGPQGSRTRRLSLQRQ